VSTKLQWGRIVAGAFLLELALFVVFVPLLVSFDVPTVVPFVVVGCFVFGFVISWWMVRKVRGRHVLHATLIGVLATAIYLLLGVAQPGGIAPVVAIYGPILFFLGNALRILGCAAGGYAGRTRMP
jgi:hypothetical protein